MGQGVRTSSLINNKIKVFLSNIGRDSPKNHKATKLAHHRPGGETPFNWCFAGVIWRFAGGPTMARFLRYLDLLGPHKKK